MIHQDNVDFSIKKCTLFLSYFRVLPTKSIHPVGDTPWGSKVKIFTFVLVFLFLFAGLAYSGEPPQPSSIEKAERDISKDRSMEQRITKKKEKGDEVTEKDTSREDKEDFYADEFIGNGQI